MKKVTKKVLKKIVEEKEKVLNYLIHLLMDVAPKIDYDYTILSDYRDYDLYDFELIDNGDKILICFYDPYGESDSLSLPCKALTNEETFKKWLIESIKKEKEKQERIKKLKKEAEEARRRAEMNTIEKTRVYIKPKELWCSKCEYSVDMANSDGPLCLVDNDIKSGNDKEQCPFYKKEQNNGKNNS